MLNRTSVAVVAVMCLIAGTIVGYFAPIERDDPIDADTNSATPKWPSCNELVGEVFDAPPESSGGSPRVMETKGPNEEWDFTVPDFRDERCDTAPMDWPQEWGLPTS